MLKILNMYYLKYRPKTISEIDNSRVKTILQQTIQLKEIPHALLFVGQKGTGKTSSARIFSKAVNCLNNKFSTKSSEFEPCNTCANCISIDNSTFTDVLEMDAASNRGIEDIKKLIKETSFLPMMGNYRVFIIDEAHMITTEGFNALLKTLEEPPKTVIFILATTNLEKLPKTIISRCIKVNFGKAKRQDIINMLKRIRKIEKADIKDEILEIIAQHSDYSFRDATKLLEEIINQKLISSEEVDKYIGIRGKNNLLSNIEKKSIKETLKWIDEFAQGGGNFKTLIEDLLEKLRIILLQSKGIQEEDEKYDSSLTMSEAKLLIKLLMEAYNQLKSTPIESLPLEIALLEFYNIKK